jgi:hypothetical protein
LAAEEILPEDRQHGPQQHRHRPSSDGQRSCHSAQLPEMAAYGDTLALPHVFFPIARRNHRALTG